MRIIFTRFHRRKHRGSLAIFFAEKIAHLGASNSRAVFPGVVEIAAATAENRAIYVHSAVHPTLLRFFLVFGPKAAANPTLIKTWVEMRDPPSPPVKESWTSEPKPMLKQDLNKSQASNGPLFNLTGPRRPGLGLALEGPPNRVGGSCGPGRYNCVGGKCSSPNCRSFKGQHD